MTDQTTARDRAIEAVLRAWDEWEPFSCGQRWKELDRAIERLRALAGAPTADVAAFLRWLVSMDDPEDANGLDTRRTVTLTQIIDRARALLAAPEGVDAAGELVQGPEEVR